MMRYTLKAILVVMVLVVVSSCDTEYLDPNSTLEPTVVSSSDNLVDLINGIQLRYSSDRYTGVIYNSVHLTGLNTGELRLINAGNASENDILIGGSTITGDNSILVNLWTNSMLCRKEASTVYDSADEATSDATAANTLKAYALFYKALVHGTLIQYFEQVPLEIIENAPFNTRSEVLASAIEDLTEAKGYVDAGLSSEITSGLYSSVDIGNSINALLARFNLMAGNYEAAITAADDVDLSVASTWEFDASIPNPLAYWFSSQNVTQAMDQTFTLPDNLLPDENDKRVSFYVEVEDPTDPDYQLAAFFDENLDEIPVYLPGEMLLIKAEAYARQSNLTDAVDALDEVLTKTASSDVFGIGAELPAYSGAVEQSAILDEIYKNRRIELYLSGLGLEDSRRFDRPGPSDADAERNKNFYPYPNTERDNNENTPANPTS